MPIYSVTRVYKDVIKSIQRVNCLRGGTRSTKSFSLTQMAVRWLMYGKIGDKEILNGDFFILRESFPALRRTVLKDFTMILSHEGFMPYVNHIKTTHEFKREGRTVSFFSVDDPAKIHGPQNTMFWINEATAVTRNVFDMLIFRCSHFCFLDYNPYDPECWVKTYIEDERLEDKGDVSLDVSTVYDNPYLSKEQYEEILSIKDKEIREIYLKGNWTKLTGLIFPNYQVIKELPTDYQKRYHAIDFGWVDPTVLLEFRQKGNDVFIHEHVYASEYHYDDLSEYINTNLNAVRGAADPSSPRSIRYLQDRGVRVKGAKKGPDSIIEGIQHVRTHNLFITRDSINLLKELKTYKWKKDSEGNEIQKPIDEFNHACDAIRYGLTTFSKKRIFNIV